MKTGTIYGLLCPLEKRIVYIGQTAKPLSYRLAVHKSSAVGIKKSKRAEWLRGLLKENLLDDLLIVSLQDSIELPKLNECEAEWIDRYRAIGDILNEERKIRYSRADNGSLAEMKPVDAALRTRIKIFVFHYGYKFLSSRLAIDVTCLQHIVHEGVATPQTVSVIETCLPYLDARLRKVLAKTPIIRPRKISKTTKIDTVDRIKLLEHIKGHGKQRQLARQAGVPEGQISRLVKTGRCANEAYSKIMGTVNQLLEQSSKNLQPIAA